MLRKALLTMLHDNRDRPPVVARPVSEPFEFIGGRRVTQYAGPEVC